jgi:hypothetical protein
VSEGELLKRAEAYAQLNVSRAHCRELEKAGRPRAQRVDVVPPTPLGETFVHPGIKVPKDARDLDSRRLSFAGLAVSIAECLGERFRCQNQWAGRD